MTNFYINNSSCDMEIVSSIKKEFGISELVATVMVKRGLKDIEDCKDYLFANISDMHDPFLLNDMDIAVKRICQAIDNDESIWIFGDYDVDGVTSTSLLKLFLAECGVNPNFYIPNRFTEGYGINNEAVRKIKEAGGDLIISVDCGITSIEQVKECNELGMDIIITDHHECQDDLPDAVAVINPKRPDSQYPFNNLAGVGVALKVVQAIAIQRDIKINYEKYLPIVAFGTVADIVSIRGENRIIVKHGLQMMSNNLNKGLKALIKECGLEDKSITSGHVGYMLAPRINACGRLDSADYGVELLTCNDDIRTKEIAKLLNDENLKRQDIEAEILDKALEIIQGDKNYEKERVLIVQSEGWNHGVIGIVSSRLTEKFYKPSVVISLEDNKGRGSARSIKNFDMFKNLSKCKSLFEKFGGHEQAAGLSIDKANIGQFRKLINEIADDELAFEDLVPEVKVDKELEFDEINVSNINELKLLEPFGMGNSSPVFMVKNAKIVDVRTIGKEGKHLKILLDLDNRTIDALYFNKGDLLETLLTKRKIDVLFTMNVNEFRGVVKPQLIVKKIVLKHDLLQKLNNNYMRSFNKLINHNDLGKIEVSKDVSVSQIDKIVEFLDDDKPTVVLASNYLESRKLFEFFIYKGRKFHKNIGFGYNTIDDDDDDKQNLILINPTVCKNELDRFDRIIMLGEVLSVDENLVEDKQIVMISDNEEKNLEFFLVNILPSIEELRTIYKYLLVNKQKKKYNITCSVNEIMDKFSVVINRFKLELGLFIFDDCGLIELELSNDEYLIKKNLSTKNVDMLNNKLYKRYLECKDEILGSKQDYNL